MTARLLSSLFSLSLILFVSSAWAGVPSPKAEPQNILPNNDFSQLDETGNPIGWSCACQSESQVCPVSNDPQSGGKILSLKPGCTLRSDKIAVHNQKQGIHFEVLAKQVPPHLQDLTLQINSAGATHIFQQTAQPNSSKPVQNAVLLQAETASSQDARSMNVAINNFHLQEMQIQKIISHYRRKFSA